MYGNVHKVCSGVTEQTSINIKRHQEALKVLICFHITWSYFIINVALGTLKIAKIRS